MAILNRHPKKTKQNDDSEDDAKENQVFLRNLFYNILYLNSFLFYRMMKKEEKKKKKKAMKKKMMKVLVNKEFIYLKSNTCFF